MVDRMTRTDRQTDRNNPQSGDITGLNIDNEIVTCTKGVITFPSPELTNVTLSRVDKKYTRSFYLPMTIRGFGATYGTNRKTWVWRAAGTKDSLNRNYLLI